MIRGFLHLANKYLRKPGKVWRYFRYNHCAHWHLLPPLSPSFQLTSGGKCFQIHFQDLPSSPSTWNLQNSYLKYPMELCGPKKIPEMSHKERNISPLPYYKTVMHIRNWEQNIALYFSVCGDASSIQYSLRHYRHSLCLVHKVLLVITLIFNIALKKNFYKQILNLYLFKCDITGFYSFW